MGISAALGSSALLPAGLGFRNVLINGGFDVWQRTTSSEYTPSAGTVTYQAPDRWWSTQLSTTSTLIISQATADTSFLRYGCKVQRKSGQTGTGAIYFGQTLESSMSKTFAGRTATVSFYAKKGANAPSTFSIGVYAGKGTDQSSGALFSTGWTNGAYLLQQTVTPTTTMTRYSYSFTVDSSYTQIGLWFYWTPSGTAGADEWFQFEGVQLEANVQPTPFEQRPYGVELALCQRYFYAPNETDNNGYSHYGLGFAYSTTQAFFAINTPVQMRVPITSSRVSYSTLRVSDTVGAWAITAISVSDFTKNRNAIQVDATIGSASLTAFRPALVQGNNSTSAYFRFDAEL
jgi:hypothetical protein